MGFINEQPIIKHFRPYFHGNHSKVGMIRYNCCWMEDPVNTSSCLLCSSNPAGMRQASLWMGSNNSDHHISFLSACIWSTWLNYGIDAWRLHECIFFGQITEVKETFSLGCHIVSGHWNFRVWVAKIKHGPIVPWLSLEEWLCMKELCVNILCI